MSFHGFETISYCKIEGAKSHYSYICGHCNTKVSGFIVAEYKASGTGIREVQWLLCTDCGKGSVLNFGGNIYPGVLFGPNIEGLPDNINEAYQEARKCMSVNAYTGCELICRKILMNVAVEKGAKEGDFFIKYIDHLEDKGYITPPMKGWVDLIKDRGNKATHEIETPDKERAESTLMFTAELLRIIYEMEYMSKKYTKEPEEE